MEVKIYRLPRLEPRKHASVSEVLILFGAKLKPPTWRQILPFYLTTIGMQQPQSGHGVGSYFVVRTRWRK
jgi:hypothetical protein